MDVLAGDQEAQNIVKARALRVLLVEDSATMRVYLGHHLRALFPSVQIMEAEDGKSALRQLSAGSVDLVLTDLRMPGMDGEDFVQMLKRNPLLRRKPVLVVSADAGLAAQASWAGEPGLRILAKPLKPGELESAILGLLGPQ